MKKAATMSAIIVIFGSGCHPNYIEETVSPKNSVKATNSNAVVPQSTASPATAAPGLQQPSSAGGDFGDSGGSVGQAAKDRARKAANPPAMSVPDEGSPGG